MVGTVVGGAHGSSDMGEGGLMSNVAHQSCEVIVSELRTGSRSWTTLADAISSELRKALGESGSIGTMLNCVECVSDRPMLKSVPLVDGSALHGQPSR